MELIRRAAEFQLPRGGSRSRFRRLCVLTGLCIVWMGLLVARLWDFQIRRGDELAGRAASQQVQEIEIRAERGSIYDRRGVELALSPFVDSIAVFPEKVNDKAAMAEALSGALAVPPGRALELLSKSGFQWVKRFAEPAESAELQRLVRNGELTGLHIEKEGKRYYPKGSIAAHVVGYVGIDHNGQGGLEQQYDSLLTGQSGVRRVHFDALRQQYDSSVVQAPTAGASLVLTIDESVQAVAESSLAAAIGRTQARAGSIVMMDPEKGDVLAMANWPAFDPNLRPRGAAELEARQNYAISHLYEPGSTFKVVTVAAAIEQGITKPSELIDCQNGWIYIGRRRIRDHKPYGLLTVTQILANSSNVGAIKIGMRLGADHLHDYVRRFGFGAATGIELPGEIDGLVRPARLWRDGSVASISMGQEIGATPLQLAQAYSVVANGGFLVRPRIVDAIRQPSGEVEQAETHPRTRVISAETAANLRAMMEQTVLVGTAQAARTPGYRVAGKTGTAQLIDPETRAYSADRHIASFAAIAPLNDPSLVTVIVLDSPRGREYYGGQVAAPVFPGLASQALRFRDVPPTEPLVASPGLAGAPPPTPDADVLLAQSPVPQVWQDGDGAILVSGLAPAVRAAPAPADPADGDADSPAEGAEPAEPERAGPPARLRVTAVETPDFVGMTVREAVAEAAERGLELEMRGAGLASSQQPPAGTAVQPGTLVLIRFGRTTGAAGATQ